MDSLYLPDGRQLALIDRDWILDELPHLGNPDDNSDVNYLLTSVTAATGGSSRSTAGIGTGGGSSNGLSTNTGAAETGGSLGANHQNTGANHNHTLLYNSDELEGDLTLVSEIVDETQNKWSDFGLNQLLTPYARLIRPVFK